MFLPLVILGPPCPAQDLLFEFPDTGSARAVSDGGDIDADGVRDFIVGTTSGRVRIYSGSSGRIIFELDAPGKGDGFGQSVAGAGDLDGDGHGDFLIGAPQNEDLGPGYVRLHSGRTGAVLRIHRGTQRGARFGQAVRGLGDLDGDQVPDYAVGVPYHDNTGKDSGLIRIYSGKTGGPIRFFPGRSAGVHFGAALGAIGDVNGDSRADVVAGAPQGDYVLLLSGKDMKVLLELKSTNPGEGFGSEVGSPGDLDKDGRPDLFAGAPGYRDRDGRAGIIRAYSGVSGKLLFSVKGPSPIVTLHGLNGASAGGMFGRAVSPAGDVDQDGHADLCIGAFLASNNGPGSGTAVVLSGKDATLLHRFDGDAAGDLFGIAVARAGDVDRDGSPDLLIGAERGSYAKVLSGKDGKELYRFKGKAWESFGAALAGALDLDRDGHPDLLIGAPQAYSATGYVRAYSGKDGRILRSIPGASRGEQFGQAVCAAGDLNRDGYADFAVSAPAAKSLSGSVRFYSGKDGKLLRIVAGAASGDLFGWSLALGGDFDRDGFADLLVGAPGAKGFTGTAQVLAGKDGRTLLAVEGAKPLDWFGLSVGGLGGLPGDEPGDFLVGAPERPFSSKPGAGYARLYSAAGKIRIEYRGKAAGELLGFAVASAGDSNADGKTDLLIGSPGSKQWTGSAFVFAGLDPESRFGGAISGTGDYNSDGHPDLLAGAAAQSQVLVLSGKDGKQLASFAREVPRFGSSVAALDLNLDGARDLVISAAGSLFVLSGRKLTLRYDRARLPASTGGTQLLDLAAGPGNAGKLYVLLGSLSGISPGLRLGRHALHLNPDSYTLFTWMLPSRPPLLNSRGYLDAQGSARAAFTLPPLPGLQGLAFHHAYFVFAFDFSIQLTSNPAVLLIEK